MSINKTKIDWPFKPLYTWNPIIGCKFNCNYCYARRMNDRFKWIPNWTEPNIDPLKLWDRMPRKPSFIFVGSMSDIFGDWVPSDFIIDLIYHVKCHPEHIFLFLTKNPERYSEFVFPDNVWLGATVTSFTTELDTLLDFHTPVNCKSFLSIEPILGEFNDVSFPNMDLIIVGAMSGPGAIKPTLEQVKSIDHFNVWYKDSIRELYPELKNSESIKNPYWISKKEWDFLKTGKYE